MNPAIHITRAFIFLVLVSFAPAALSIVINSEMGTQSLDGAWEFGCSEPDPEDDLFTDYNELLVFEGDIFKVQAMVFSSTGGDCSSEDYSLETFVTGNMLSFDFELFPSWEDSIVPDALGGGSLNESPVVTPLAFDYFDEEDGVYVLEPAFFYIDDTALASMGKICFSRNPEDYESVTSTDPFTAEDYPTSTDYDPAVISAEEPLCRIDLEASPVPLPSAIWLFGIGLIGLVGFTKQRKTA